MPTTSAFAPLMMAERDRYEDTTRRAAQAESRRYQDMLEEKRRQQRITDDDRMRVRNLRTQLSALMPPGQTVPADWTEEQMARELATRRRETDLQWKKDDMDRQLVFERSRAKTLSEDALNQSAIDYGVSESLNRAEKIEAIAQAKAKRDAQQQQFQMNEGLNAARSAPGYENLKSKAAVLKAQMESLLASGLPEPTYHQGLGPEERLRLYQELAASPSVVAAFSQFKDSKNRLAAMAAGDSEKAFAGMNPDESFALRDAIANAEKEVRARIEGDVTLKNMTAYQGYLARMRDIPAQAQEYRRQLDQLYTLPNNIGMALRMEDQDSLTRQGVQIQQQSMPGTVGTATMFQGNAMTDSGPRESMPGEVPGALPAPGEFVQVQAEDPNQIRGAWDILKKDVGPGIVNASKTAYGGIISDPNLAGIGTATAPVAGTARELIGNPVNNVLAGIGGGTLKESDLSRVQGSPVDIPVGLAQAAMSPFSMIGRGMGYVGDRIPRREFDWRTPIEEQTLQAQLAAQRQEILRQNPMLQYSAAMGPVVR